MSSSIVFPSQTFACHVECTVAPLQQYMRTQVPKPLVVPGDGLIQTVVARGLALDGRNRPERASDRELPTSAYDAFGVSPAGRYPESPSLLYKVVDSRNGRGSTAFLTNVDFSEWTEYLGDPALVMALLDRVSDNAIVVRFKGKSYRKNRTKHAS